MHSSTLHLCAALLAALGLSALADVPVPPNVLNPQTAAEAWNVIRLSTANVDRLIDEKRLTEIPAQIALCSPALRELAREKWTDDAKTLSDKAAGWVVAVARAGRESNEAGARTAMVTLRTLLDRLAAMFDPAVVKAEIHLCPMHPDVISTDPRVPCSKCGMALIPRRIPYSFLYVTPGEPTIRLTASADAPIEAGRKTRVTVRLARADGSPVRHADLMVMHTQPIHLLIEDPSLDDYHHEHPLATDTPGEYTFSFTPKRTSPYRIWADLVPVATGLQELPFADLPSAGKAGAIEDKSDRFTATAGGLHFTLTSGGSAEVRPHAQTACGLEVSITDANGQPMTRLEPLMNAFAHLVGFYDDYHTVVHIHPGGGDVLRAEARGGPSLIFTFFPPRPGFIRLYCQVQVNGESVFAPFGVNVAP